MLYFYCLSGAGTGTDATTLTGCRFNIGYTFFSDNRDIERAFSHTGKAGCAAILVNY
jgi:hypothetical protein